MKRAERLREGNQTHPDGSKERWRDVPKYAGEYRVSDRGRVKTLARVVKHKGSKRGMRVGQRILRGSKNKAGYVIVELRGGKRFGVHQLVLLAFRGPCPPGLFSRHMNGNPSDNRLSNLRWGTITANNRDRIRHGTIPRGEAVNTSKLTPAEVLEIREVLDRPLPAGRTRRPRGQVAAMCKKYRVSSTELYKIANRVDWKHLP